MARDTLTGSRIRERRIMSGIRQAELARHVDISASYLNLIEHNKRRIGGKLLLDIAAVLGVEPSLLTEGAEATLIATLREAASDQRDGEAEVEKVDEFAGRFPGWAGLLAENRRRVGTLEHAVQTLSDRMTHDPQLAASLHEMLTSVTSIRSTAAILADGGEIEPEWQDRFHRNINEDSARLAEISRALVQYLDKVDDASANIGAPQDELDSFLSQHGYCFPELETAPEIEQFAQTNGQGLSAVAGKMLGRLAERYASDAAELPKDRLAEAVEVHGLNPWAIAQTLRADPDLVLRRLAVWGEALGLGPLGLAVCDASGTLLLRKTIDDFPFPRFGSACPLLPLFEALSRPGQPIERVVSMPGQDEKPFRAFALCRVLMTEDPRMASLSETVMLIAPLDRAAPEGTQPVGVSCQICPRERCRARREPSILGAEA